MAGIAYRPPFMMLSKASRNGLGHLVLPLGFHTTSMITGIPTIVIASCTLVSAFMLPSQASRGRRVKSGEPVLALANALTQPLR